MTDAQPRIRTAVAIGGGHGQARTLQALRTIASQVTAIATVADDGGSSGRLREDLGVLPPGDLRMALGALSEDPEVGALLNHRFQHGSLSGHSAGNLLMIAATEVHGGFVAGLDAVARMIGVPHRVLPSTLTDVHLAADGPDGTIVGQAAIAATPGLTEYRLVADTQVAGCKDAIEAIGEAELVVLGPGSVATSILPNLLVPEIADALSRSPGRRVLVANLDEQRGEGEGRSIADHVRLLYRAAPELIIDTVLVHDGPQPPTGRPPLGPDDELTMMVGGVRTGDLLDRGATGGHSPTALADALLSLLT